MWKSGQNMVCLQDSASDWCFLESQKWIGSDYVRWSPLACYNEDQSAIPVQCSDPTWSVTEITDGMKDVTRLYNSSLLCSECFIKIWRQRLMSPLLPDGAHTQYLLDQYQNIQRNCSTTLPVTTYGTTLLVTATTTVTASTPAGTVTATATSTTCMGQLVQPFDTYRPCFNISDTYNVSTGAVVRATNNEFCEYDSPICLPPPCEIDTVWYNPTCEELAQKYSTASNNITLTQFLTWNANILGSCGFLNDAQRICKSPPGGHFSPTGVVYAPTAAGSYYSTATAAEPTQSGTTASCGLFYNVVSGDTCNSVALRFGITFDELQNLNTFLWNNCTNLWLDNSICVAPVTTASTSTNGACGPANGNTVFAVRSMAIAEPHLITAVQVTVFPGPVRPPSQPRTVPVVLLGGVLLAQIQALGPAAQSMAIVEVGRITAVQENATLVTRPVLARNLAIAALLLVIVEAQRITVLVSSSIRVQNLQLFFPTGKV
ncbi:hypothetical protein CBS147339_8519 [Penicillium roqueforti]|nr:hypothetical protein CBS147339_8519 [Penicillium roqueforti]KAI3094372.1 hypothetical protein CBS147338_6518 [Penicillium roqueforti]KAI3131319.1 hypothetical protein CBS147325_9165 [Penicillium roqueforti]KAI3151814.1 hypothetical protein DTO046C5_9155 [Penicillium roqueforti]KAI3180636.1 hypothetical protein DTO032C6_8336 [Penicillium roqueforti]